METHQIGGNRERRVLNNFSFSIAKINVFDCLNRLNGNRKCLIRVRRLPFWQSKTLYLAIVNNFSENERSFAIAAYPVWEKADQKMYCNISVLLVFMPKYELPNALNGNKCAYIHSEHIFLRFVFIILLIFFILKHNRIHVPILMQYV